MAIKSKKRSKPKQVAKPPKREPVPPPVPFVRQRWVQVTAAFLVGIGAMILFVWITNGIRSSGEEPLSEADTVAQRRGASEAWRDALLEELDTVGSVEPGAMPMIMTDTVATIDALAEGEGIGAPKTVTQLERDAGAATRAARRIARIEVAEIVRDQGFDRFEASLFTTSQRDIAAALRLYARAADVAALAAAEVDEATRERLIEMAQAISSEADDLLESGWDAYLSTLAAGGVFEQPAADPGALPGGLPEGLPEGFPEGINPEDLPEGIDIEDLMPEGTTPR